MTDEIRQLTEKFTQYQIQVVQGMGDMNGNIGKLGVQVEALVEQVKKQNGNVTTLNQRMAVVENHPFNCVMRDKVTGMEQKLDSIDGSNKVASQWKTGLLIPTVKWLVIGAISMALLIIGMHFNSLFGV